jgi:hypothetical protein
VLRLIGAQDPVLRPRAAPEPRVDVPTAPDAPFVVPAAVKGD